MPHYARIMQNERTGNSFTGTSMVVQGGIWGGMGVLGVYEKYEVAYNSENKWREIRRKSH